MPILRRTHTCGELRAPHAGQTVVLNGWVNTYRNQGAVVFVDLRDRYGKTQVIFEADKPELVKADQDLRNEICVDMEGKVQRGQTRDILDITTKDKHHRIRAD